MPANKPQRKSQKSVERSALELISSAPGGLDAIDRQIISQLQIDGRRAYGAIADEVGLSEAAVRRRVQRMRETGVTSASSPTRSPRSRRPTTSS
jgi:DNA-directed RNA polymerase specialized sigma24 family protein